MSSIALIEYSRRQTEYEKEWLNEKKIGFDAKECNAWRLITEKLGPKVSKQELLSIGRVISHELNIPLTREYKRRKIMMIKWFDENIDKIENFFRNNLIVVDDNDNSIEFDHTNKYYRTKLVIHD